jgi:shikimate 5-dehydrogenase
MLVADVTRIPDESPLLSEARQRGCIVVRSSYLFGGQLSSQFHAVTGEEFPARLFHEALGIGG